MKTINKYTINDINVYDIVKTRDGNCYVVLPCKNSKNNLGLYSGNSKIDFCDAFLSNYFVNLKSKFGPEYDITEIYKTQEDNPYYALKLFFSGETDRFEFEKIAPPREMTLEEVQIELGYEVKIIAKNEKENNE